MSSGQKVLSIKFQDDDYFIPVNNFDPLSFLLKSSLEDIVMNNNVEIIISSSKHVKMSKEIIIPTEKSHHDTHVDNIKSIPQWRIIDLIYRDTFEGIHLSRQTDHNQNHHLSIHSLSFEIDDPIQFSKEAIWSVQINSPVKNELVAFSDSTPQKLHKIIQILFKKNLEIKFFKNSHDLFEPRENIKIQSLPKNGDYQISWKSIDLKRVFLIELKETTQIIHSIHQKGKNDKDITNPSSLPKNLSSYCLVNFRLFLKLHSLLLRLDDIIKSDKNVRFINSHHELQKSFLHRETQIFFTIDDVKPDFFIEIFQEKLGKLFFDLSIEAVINMLYDSSENRLIILIERGAFALPIGNYIIQSFEEYEVDLLEDQLYKGEGSLKIENKRIKIENQKEIEEEYTLNYRIFDPVASNSINFSSTKRILVVGKPVLFDSIVKRISKNKPETTERFVSLYFITVLMNLDQLVPQDSGLEIIVEDQNNSPEKKITCSSLTINIPLVTLIRPSFYRENLLQVWKLFVMSPKSEPDGASSSSKSEPDHDILLTTSLVHSSHDILLNMWKDLTIEENLYLIVKRTHSHNGNNIGNNNENNNGNDEKAESKTISIENIKDKSHYIQLLKILLSINSPFEILEFRLKYQFQIEVDIVSSKDKSESDFLDYIDKKLNEIPFSTKLRIPSMIPSMMNHKEQLKILSIDDHRCSAKFNIVEDLFWDDAIHLLINKKPSNLSTIQVMERENGNYLAFGHVLVFYYHGKGKGKLADHIKNLKDRHQIMRIGKFESKANDLFILFVQYSINKMDFANVEHDFSTEEGSNRVDCVIVRTDMIQTRSISVIMEFVINYQRELGNIHRATMVK